MVLAPCIVCDSICIEAVIFARVFVCSVLGTVILNIRTQISAEVDVVARSTTLPVTLLEQQTPRHVLSRTQNDLQRYKAQLHSSIDASVDECVHYRDGWLRHFAH